MEYNILQLVYFDFSFATNLYNKLQLIYVDFSIATNLYNNLQLIYVYFALAGIDHLLALHLSHLFIRDPVSLFSEKINQNDEEDTDHFEVRGPRNVILYKYDIPVGFPQGITSQRED